MIGAVGAADHDVRPAKVHAEPERHRSGDHDFALGVRRSLAEDLNGLGSVVEHGLIEQRALRPIVVVVGRAVSRARRQRRVFESGAEERVRGAPSGGAPANAASSAARGSARSALA